MPDSNENINPSLEYPKSRVFDSQFQLNDQEQQSSNFIEDRDFKSKYPIVDFSLSNSNLSKSIISLS